jgi:hypothetical protein
MSHCETMRLTANLLVRPVQSCRYPVGYSIIFLDTVPLILPCVFFFHLFEILLRIHIAVSRQNACFTVVN